MSNRQAPCTNDRGSGSDCQIETGCRGGCGDDGGHLLGPVVAATHRVVEVAVAEVEQQRRALACCEERRQPSSTGSTSIVGVKRENERVGQLGQGNSDCLISVRGGENSDCSVASGSCGQRVDSPFGDDDLRMTYFGRTSADHAGVGSELARRVQIARPIPRRTDDPELRVDRMAVVDDGEHDARGAGHPVRSLLPAGPGVCADSVAGEDVGRQASSVGEPASGGDPLRAPETCSAVVDIAVEALLIGTA